MINMSQPVVFCKDGVLRVYNRQSKTSVVATDVSTAFDIPPSLFFLSILRNEVILEEGSTIASFLKCIEPWEHLVSALTDRDVLSYINAVKRPSEAVNAYDRIELRARCSFARAFDRTDYENIDNISEWINKPLTFSKDKFAMGVTFDISGYKNDGDENWSVSSAGIQKIKNVPLVLNRNWITVVSQYSRDNSDSLINDNCPGVKQLSDGSRSRYLNCEVDGEVDWNVQRLIECVICDGLWYHTPEDEERSSSHVADILAQIDSGEMELHTISAPEEDEDQDDDGEDESSEESSEKRPTIMVADGAFDGIGQRISREQREWMKLTAVVSNPVRLGEFTEAVPEDDRVMGYRL